MAASLANCWEIKRCGRQKGGAKVAELGECIAARDALGHSCWAVAGTLCGGIVQGSVAQKEGNCVTCEVYQDYNRITGTKCRDVPLAYPDEQRRYSKLLLERLK